MRYFNILSFLALTVGVLTAHAAETPVPINNAGFEGAYQALPAGGTVTGATAPGWTHNSGGFGDTTTVYAQDFNNPHSGASCQSIAVSAVRSGNLQLTQNVKIKGGSIYTLGAWVRGTPGSVAGLTLLGSGPGYTQYVSANTSVDATWRYITALGYVTSSDTAALIIHVDQPGTICIDDITLSMRPGAPTPSPIIGPISSQFFGIHVENIQYDRLRNAHFYDPSITAGIVPSQINGEIAHGWEDNSSWADVDITYATDPGLVPGGGHAQKVNVGAVRSGRQQLRQQIELRPGLSYTFAASIKTVAGTHVQMLLGNSEAPYNSYATLDLANLDGQWHDYAITGKVGSRGIVNLMFASDAPGSYSVGNVRLATADGGRPLSGVTFPPNKFGILRLWDSGVTWAKLEPKPGVWLFDQLDRFVAAAKPGQDIILTLGQSPTWASSDPLKFTYIGAGASAPPQNIADWSNYIQSVAQRYKGKIKYYEVWNEPNDSTFYSGTVAQLATLTQAASVALKAVDPNAKLITAPAYTSSYLDQYLATGAAQYADIIGYHIYATPPEAAAAEFGNVRLVLQKNNITAMPLWDTEGGSGDQTTPAAVAATYMARKYLTDLAFGAGNFNWYQWGLVSPFAIGTVDNTTRLPTPAAQSFAVMRGWLTGASVKSAAFDSAGTWSIAFTLGDGKSGIIAWNPKKTAIFMPPAGFSPQSIKTLTGQTSPAGAPINLTFSPVLIVGQ